MRGIIVKCNTRMENIAYDAVTEKLSHDWNEYGILLLPNFIDLVAIVDDDADANMLIKCDEVIKNEKAPKIE